MTKQLCVKNSKKHRTTVIISRASQVYLRDVISRSRNWLSTPLKVRFEEQGRGKKDKRNCHNAVGKSSSEQYFRKSAAIAFIM